MTVRGIVLTKLTMERNMCNNMYVCAQEERDDNITGCFNALKATIQDKMQNVLLPSSTGIESQNPKYANFWLSPIFPWEDH